MFNVSSGMIAQTTGHDSDDDNKCNISEEDEHQNKTICQPQLKESATFAALKPDDAEFLQKGLLQLRNTFDDIRLEWNNKLQISKNSSIILNKDIMKLNGQISEINKQMQEVKSENEIL